MRLSDKVALVTGAGRGIGKAIALRFSDEGAKVVVNDIEPAYAENIADRLKQMGRRALAVKADVCNWPEVKLMFERAAREFSYIDILVNNAGIRKDSAFPNMSEEEWDSVMAVQLKGTFNCTRAAQRYMVKQGYGKIVNISSPVPAALGTQGQTNYSTANAGLEGFTKSLARELGAYNINVNCISPDFIDTEMTRMAARRDGMYFDDLKRFVVAEIPLRRLGKPEDVANVALFLASDESSFVSGQILYVKGGP
jgi:3-oxoacyl-[acyl-carrier protein] reductase